MATKTIAVTLANIQNTGEIPVSPRGIIQCRTVRAVDDEQVFQRATLFNSDQGTIFIPPGESLSFNVMEQLTVSHFDQESDGHLNQMLLIFAELTQGTEVYFGENRKKVRFDDIKTFQVVTCLHNTASANTARFTATYTVSLLKEER